MNWMFGSKSITHQSIIGWKEVNPHYPSAFTQRAAISASPAPGQYNDALFVSFATMIPLYLHWTLVFLSPFLFFSRLQTRRREEDRWQKGVGGRGTRAHCQRMASSQARSAAFFMYWVSKLCAKQVSIQQALKQYSLNPTKTREWVNEPEV